MDRRVRNKQIPRIANVRLLNTLNHFFSTSDNVGNILIHFSIEYQSHIEL